MEMVDDLPFQNAEVGSFVGFWEDVYWKVECTQSK